MTERLQKEAAKAMKEELAEAADREDQFGEDYVVTKESRKKAQEKQNRLLQDMA